VQKSGLEIPRLSLSGLEKLVHLLIFSSGTGGLTTAGLGRTAPSSPMHGTGGAIVFDSGGLDGAASGGHG
jgi:hypothetical protein